MDSDLLLQARVRNVRLEGDRWKAEVHVYGSVFIVDTRNGSWGVEDGEAYKHVHSGIAAMCQEQRRKIERKERRGT